MNLINRAHKLKDKLNLGNLLVVAYILFVTIFWYAFHPHQEIATLLSYIDKAICLGIIVNFLGGLAKSANKILYLKKNWIMIIAALPAVGALAHLGEYIRLLRFLILVRLFSNENQHHTQQNELKRDLKILIIMGLFVLIVSSILILYFENVPEGNIKTAEDALWWSIVTAATVGYGDFYPITTGGRIVATILIFTGVSIFVSITSLLANLAIQSNVANLDKKNNASDNPINE